MKFCEGIDNILAVKEATVIREDLLLSEEHLGNVVPLVAQGGRPGASNPIQIPSR